MQFIEKYRPKRIQEIVGQDESLRQLMKFVLNVIGKKSLKKGVILYGPPGTGKTYKTKEKAVRIIGDDLYG